MPDKPEVKQAKPLNLTDLSRGLEHCNDMLQQHTQTRNFLFRVINNDVSPPVFSFDDEKMGPDSKPYQIDLAKMPPEIVELLLISMIDHEEKMAFHYWAQIAEIGQQALKVIEHVKEQRAHNKTDEEELKIYGPTEKGKSICSTEEVS